MPEHPINDPKHWLNRAKEARALAEQMGVKNICSKAFHFSGVCGTPTYPWPGWSDVVWYTNPWEPGPITIVKQVMTITATSPTPQRINFQQAFMGNSFSPDPVSAVENLLVENATTATFRIESPTWPAGTGMIFPGATPNQTYNDPHLDAHIGASAPIGATFWGFVVVWYMTPKEGDDAQNGTMDER